MEESQPHNTHDTEPLKDEATESLTSFIKWIYHYSGAKFIYRKFNPPKDSGALPTGVIWAVGIYVAFFGVASQRYENRIDIIENRANSIFAQLAVPSVQKKALDRISRVQNMPCPYKPNILNLPSVFISLFRDSEYEEMIEQLKETVEDWKGSLDSVDLREAKLGGADLRKAKLVRAYLGGTKLAGTKLGGVNVGGADLRKAYLVRANLRGADLWGADLREAYLRGVNVGGADLREADLREADLRETDLREANLVRADLRKAKLVRANLRKAKLVRANLRGADLRGASGLSAQQLCKASTLYMVILDQELEAQIKQECPDLLKEPQRNNPDEKK